MFKLAKKFIGNRACKFCLRFWEATFSFTFVTIFIELGIEIPKILKIGKYGPFLIGINSLIRCENEMAWNSLTPPRDLASFLRSRLVFRSGPDWSFLKIDLATGNHVSQYHL